MYEQALYEAAENYDYVAAVGWQFYDALADENGVLSYYPDTRFLFIDNALETIPENLVCITYTQNEGSFLAGYVAASLSQTGVIGVVGPTRMDYSTVAAKLSILAAGLSRRLGGGEAPPEGMHNKLIIKGDTGNE